MKPNIHPHYNPAALITCTSCGNTFKSGSTKQSITVEVCFRCHPFYTGEHRFLDVKGRVEAFQKKQAKAKQYQAGKSLKKKKRSDKEEHQPKTLRQLLGEI